MRHVVVATHVVVAAIFICSVQAYIWTNREYPYHTRFDPRPPGRYPWHRGHSNPWSPARPSVVRPVAVVPNQPANKTAPSRVVPEVRRPSCGRYDTTRQRGLVPLDTSASEPRRHDGDPSRPRFEESRHHSGRPDRPEPRRRLPSVPSRPTQGSNIDNVANTDSSRPTQESNPDYVATTDSSRPTQERYVEYVANTDRGRPTRRGSHESHGRHSDGRHHSDRRHEHHKHGHRGSLLEHPPHRGRPHEGRGQRGNRTGGGFDGYVSRRGESTSSSSSSSSSSEEEEERGTRGGESAPYTVTCVSPDGHELRQYEEAVWATTILNSSSPLWFQRLQRYISGENNLNATIPMSLPVRMRMVRRQDGGNSNRDTFYSASFYLPRRYWDNPPTPRDEQVFLERTSLLVFAFNFSGGVDDRKTSPQYDRLHETLRQEGQPMMEERFDVQFFYAPRIEDRHGEILIEADTDSGTPTCASQIVEEPPNGIRQCGDHECPSYSEAQRINDAIVIREVAAGVYATKKSPTCNMTNVMRETYMPLRRYFQGVNVEGVTIPATTPILQLAVKPDRTPSICNFTYHTSFYLPEGYQATPPTPLEESITIAETESMVYYVMTFHENPTPKIVFQKYSELKYLLMETEHCFRPGEFNLAFYDAPFRPLPHLYEMWIPVDDQCNDVGDEEDFDEAVFPVGDDGNLIFPGMNDDPDLIPYQAVKKPVSRGKKRPLTNLFGLL